MTKLSVFTAFSGYDSQCMALDRLKGRNPGFDYELVGWSEIDPYAIKAHNAVYPQWSDRNYGDISLIDWSQAPDFDLFTYSSPCQDFSQAGRQAGGERGSGTRSSLLWECERAIKAKRPKYLLMENVAALVTKKFIRLFNKWQLTLEDYGYVNFAQVLNAKDYGVPQNRERIFLVSIRDDGDGPKFNFPEKMKLGKRLKDILETDVDEKYYLKDDRLKVFDGKRISNHQWGIIKSPDDIGKAVTGSDHKDPPKIVQSVVLGWTRDAKGNVVKRPPVEVANCVTSGKRDNTQNYVVEPKCEAVEPINTDIDGNASCITAGYYKYGSKTLLGGTYGTSGTAVKEKVAIPTATKEGVQEMELGGVCDLSYPNSKTRRGRVQEGGTIAPALTCGCEGALRRIEPRRKDLIRCKTMPNGDLRFYRDDEKKSGCSEMQVAHQNNVAGTVTTAHEPKMTDGYRIRKLTERECFRLMDVPDEYIDRIQGGVQQKSTVQDGRQQHCCGLPVPHIPQTFH